MVWCPPRAVNAQTIAGVTFAWVATYAGLGIFFAVAFALRRREPEHLVFALLSLALAVHAWSVAVSYQHADLETWRWTAPLGIGSGVAAAVLLVHFALLFANVGARATLVRALYGVGAAFEAAIVWPGVFHEEQAHVVQGTLAGVPVLDVNAPTTPLGGVILGSIGLATIAATALFAKAVASGRRDGIAALVGGVVLCGASLHDATIAFHGDGDLWLAPHGFMALAGGVAASLLVRYSLLGKELERRSSELERSYANLREAQAELVRKQQLAAVGELAAVIAHEVRNPLAIITNAVASLRRRELAEADRGMLLEILDEESRRLNRLVGDLLRYTRPVNVDAQPVAVGEIVERAARARGSEPGIELTLSDDASDERVSGDPDLLRQALDNLLDNAVHAMPDGGSLRVHIAAGHRDGRDGVEVVIADTGSGMAPEVLRRAKDPFFTTRPSGTGLGLSIVDRIVEAHGGTFSIESAMAKGTAVTVFLPSSKRALGAAGSNVGGRESK